MFLFLRSWSVTAALTLSARTYGRRGWGPRSCTHCNPTHWSSVAWPVLDRCCRAQKDHRPTLVEDHFQSRTRQVEFPMWTKMGSRPLGFLPLRTPALPVIVYCSFFFRLALIQNCVDVHGRITDSTSSNERHTIPFLSQTRTTNTASRLNPDWRTSSTPVLSKVNCHGRSLAVECFTQSPTESFTTYQSKRPSLAVPRMEIHLGADRSTSSKSTEP